MLENASNMIDTATREAAAATSTKARQITEILTLKTKQLLAAAETSETTKILALPSATQTATTFTHTKVALTNLKTRNSLKSLETLSSSSPLSSTSMPLTPVALETRENLKIAKNYSSSTASSSSLSKTTFKVKEILTNLTPAYLLTTLAAAIATHVKQKSFKSNSTNSNSTSNSNCCNSKSIATNKMHTFQMLQRHKDQNIYYHMNSLNPENCTNNVIQQHHRYPHQHHHQEQQHLQQKHLEPCRRTQCQSSSSSKQINLQQKIQQFLLLLTCFVAISTIFSLPHLSMATILTKTSAHMSTTYVPHTTATTSTTKTIKSFSTATKKQFLLSSSYYSSTTAAASTTLNSSSSDNESNKDNDNSYSNKKIADNSDNVDDLTSSTTLETTTIENSLSWSYNSNTSGSSNISSSPFENHILTRLIRSLDVAATGGGGSGGSGSSSSSSMFSPSPGGSSGLTNIFNQNLDTGLSNNIECPSFDESSACPCYKFEDGK